ncbi:DUF6932 family protein [Mycolicibacterium goodii]|uniref:Uncharacterized protein n=1 Tax=Mycolicibacterium goodii TaxID=134601 RepID=A0ABS6HJF6_MYCGD|nr:hypothetical protein [Mycolicibacterium goodii]MBU8822786.1 hypothetical protein [Mycolicibacterium goodii]MBU8838880.1 hypothetical protein [Mycolicibacterium goodii]
MLPELGPDGMLPPGRYRVTQGEVQARFVDGRGQLRAELWRDWEVTTRMLGRRIPLNAAWLYGPFLSDADNPAVVQCVYWAEDYELGKARLDPAVAKLLRAFALPGEVRRAVGVKVDTALAAWHCQPDMRNRDEYFAQYTTRRGEVDDLLQRVASGPRGAAPVREDAVPRRGYVEVIIGGYC